jgi:hypothetical protein
VALQVASAAAPKSFPRGVHPIQPPLRPDFLIAGRQPASAPVWTLLVGSRRPSMKRGLVGTGTSSQVAVL